MTTTKPKYKVTVSIEYTVETNEPDTYVGQKDNVLEALEELQRSTQGANVLVHYSRNSKVETVRELVRWTGGLSCRPYVKFGENND